MCLACCRKLSIFKLHRYLGLVILKRYILPQFKFLLLSQKILEGNYVSLIPQKNRWYIYYVIIHFDTDEQKLYNILPNHQIDPLTTSKQSENIISGHCINYVRHWLCFQKWRNLWSGAFICSHGWSFRGSCRHRWRTERKWNI